MNEAPSIHGLADRVIAGDRPLSPGEVRALMELKLDDPWSLLREADEVRRHHFGNDVHLCSIVNAKVGGCPEDCSFCSQSARFSTFVSSDGWTPVAQVEAAASQASERGAGALGIVTATRGISNERDLQRLLDDVQAVQDGGVEAHASVGFVEPDALVRLRDAGLTELNHNLETGRSYFEQICTTHTYDDRLATIRAAKAAGIKVCSGGVFGMGEEPWHRAELAVELRDLDVDEVPVNFLVSIDGTGLSNETPLEPMEMLQIIAVLRLTLPTKNIFVCAGRSHLRDLQPFIFTAGASGMMVGDFLTTPNRGVEDDLRMLRDLGLQVQPCSTTPEAARHRAPVAERPTTPVQEQP